MLRSNIERLKHQNTECSVKEKIVQRRLATKEQEIHDYAVSTYMKHDRGVPVCFTGSLVNCKTLFKKGPLEPNIDQVLISQCPFRC